VTKRFDCRLHRVLKEACVLNLKFKHEPINWKKFGSLFMPSLPTCTCRFTSKPSHTHTRGIKGIRRKTPCKRTVTYLHLYVTQHYTVYRDEGFKYIIFSVICVDPMTKISYSDVHKINTAISKLIDDNNLYFSITIPSSTHQFFSSVFF